MNDQVLQIIYSTLKEIGTMHKFEIPKELTLETHIIGSKGVLDSLAFVSFLVAVEQGINRQFDKRISLNNEKAFSQKQNPFRSVGTLLNYISENWNNENTN